MLIRKAAVIGAGTMGSGIAAHLANAGVPCVLLDVVPAAAGGPPRDPAQRSRLAAGAIERLLTGSPPGFFAAADAALVEPGNLEDHLDRLSGCDWIIEA